jgi:RecA/RadA recombinase|tara:strand:+ start:1196 stop:2314 length:1119 start_codon:yes stop_codon:yes gene_type:complete
MSEREPEDILNSFLKANKDDHYNFEEEENYKVSSGSLQFDLQLGGGFGPGLHRFTGMNEGGKTSEALQVMKNFLETIPNSRGFYIKAEGRLSPEMKKRSGVEFVSSHDEWEDGKCFVFESNIYESVAEIISQLVNNNEKKTKFCFVLDSVDGLILKNDMVKNYDDSSKVAGGAVVAATFMKKMSIKLAKRGHMAIFISQVRADIKLDPYSKAPVRQTTATGGNALLHFANWIVEYEPRFAGDQILQDATKKPDAKTNPIIGVRSKLIIKKSPNEKTNTKISYPIRYGRTGGTSIWIEKEIVDLLEAYSYIKKSGAWISATEDFNELLAETPFDFPDKIQGMNNLFKYIETNPELTKYLFEFFKKDIQELSLE